jgi:hypothetical protein
VPPEPITIRFPTGAWEYGFAEKVPEVGDTLVRQGQTWVVVAVTGSPDRNQVVTMAMAPHVLEHDRSPEGAS